jgi:Protein of unknown function with HXXEE motif
MNKQIKTAFLAMIVLQTVHSIEEFLFKIYEVSPQMRLAFQHAPDLAKPAFIASNLLLNLFGFICFFYWVRPAKPAARRVVWIWVGIQFVTVAGHFIWAMKVSGYHPGLVTVPLFVPLIIYAVYLLRRDLRRTNQVKPGQR